MVKRHSEMSREDAAEETEEEAPQIQMIYQYGGAR
jgi:hypothetical protein